MKQSNSLWKEKKKGTLILDISDPRTVDEGIMESASELNYYFRDQIAEIYDENVRLRAGIVPAIEKIIDKRITCFICFNEKTRCLNFLFNLVFLIIT